MCSIADWYSCTLICVQINKKIDYIIDNRGKKG